MHLHQSASQINPPKPISPRQQLAFEKVILGRTTMYVPYAVGRIGTVYGVMAVTDNVFLVCIGVCSIAGSSLCDADVSTVQWCMGGETTHFLHCSSGKAGPDYLHTGRYDGASEEGLLLLRSVKNEPAYYLV